MSGQMRIRRRLGAATNWANLPRDLLNTIVRKLPSAIDYLRFSAVCRPWNSAAQQDLHRRIEVNNKQLPVLMIPTQDNSETSRRLYNFINRLPINIDLPVPYNKRCCGSSHGWLITLDLEDLGFNLINPFTNSTIALPPLMGEVIDLEGGGNGENRYTEYYVLKAVLSADPAASPDDFAVMVIYGDANRLAVFESGEDEWNHIDPLYRGFHDIIHHKGRFHAIDMFGRVFSCDYDRLPSLKPEAAAPIQPQPPVSRKYIVESPQGELFQVWRLFGPNEGDVVRISLKHPFLLTYGFRVFKLLDRRERTRRPTWVEVRNMGDGALFLGDNHSISLKASDHVGVQPNSIYSTMELFEVYLSRRAYKPNWPVDMVVYNLGARTVSLHYVPDPAQEHMPPPIWIVPTIQGNQV